VGNTFQTIIIIAVAVVAIVVNDIVMLIER